MRHAVDEGHDGDALFLLAEKRKDLRGGPLELGFRARMARQPVDLRVDARRFAGALLLSELIEARVVRHTVEPPERLRRRLHVLPPSQHAEKHVLQCVVGGGGITEQHEAPPSHEEPVLAVGLRRFARGEAERHASVRRARPVRGDGLSRLHKKIGRCAFLDYRPAHANGR